MGKPRSGLGAYFQGDIDPCAACHREMKNLSPEEVSQIYVCCVCQIMLCKECKQLR